jgi:hypothetical protein
MKLEDIIDLLQPADKEKDLEIEPLPKLVDF